MPSQRQIKLEIISKIHDHMILVINNKTLNYKLEVMKVLRKVPIQLFSNEMI